LFEVFKNTILTNPDEQQASLHQTNKQSTCKTCT